jgi:glycerol-3-phosphate acyltransferase PlsY
MNASILLFALAIAYAVGGIPSGLLIAQRRSGVDLRSMGSGNIGATNVYRTLGLGWAAAVFAADALKGLLPVLIARGLPLPEWGVMLAAFVAVCGHVFNPYLRFKGGKGVATAFGAMLGITPWAALIALAVWAGVSFKTRIISMGSLAAAGVLPIAALILSPDTAYKIGAFFVTGLLVYSHRENIDRLRKGEEKPISRNSD